MRLRFGYGAYIPWVRRDGEHIFAVAGPDAVRMSADVPVENEDFASRSEFEVAAGQNVAFVLEWFPSHRPPPPPVDNVAELLDRAVALARDWGRKVDLRGAL